MKLILETNRGGQPMKHHAITIALNPQPLSTRSDLSIPDRTQPDRSAKLERTKRASFNTAQTVMLAVGGALLISGGDALAFGAAIQGVGTEVCNVYKAVKGYVAPAIAVLMFGIAFVELKTGNRGAQARAMGAFSGALFFANIGAIVAITKLPIASCPA
jgi:hypothetical protein